MKTLLLIALTLVLYSCTKCEQCTRVWTSEIYDLYPDGTIQTVEVNDQDQTEMFTACSNSDIKAEEETMTTEYEIAMDGFVRYFKYVGECDCK